MIAWAVLRRAPAVIWAATPRWLRLAVAGAAILLAVALAAYLLGHRDARQAQQLDAARDHIETRERIDNAIANPDGCAWLDRLRGDCPE